MHLIHAWHWRPDLWPEIRGTLGGVWMVIAWPHLRHHVWYRKALGMLVVHLGAPTLSVFALLFFVSEYVSKKQHET